MSLITGIDLSYAQGDGTSAPLPDWSKIAGDARVKFAYSRACYGADTEDYTDFGFTAFRHNHDGAKAHGIPFGAYLFALRGQDPEHQANYFLTVLDGYQGENKPVIDVEELSFQDFSACSTDSNIEWLAKLAGTIERAMCRPIIYTDDNTWTTYFGGTDAFSGHDFWIANYGVTPGKPATPNGVKNVVMHQYADNGVIPGIIGHVDLDCLLGGLDSITR